MSDLVDRERLEAEPAPDGAPKPESPPAARRAEAPSPAASVAPAATDARYKARPHWFVERFHYGAYLGSYWTARLLGRKLTFAVFSRLARWMGPAFGLTKRAMKNFDLVRPHYDAATRRRIVNGVYSNFARTSFDYAFLDHLVREADAWRIEGLEHFDAARAAAGGRFVIASAHFGNWEAIRAVAARRDAPLGLIYRAFNNKFVDQHVNGKMTELGWPAFRKGSAGGRRLFKHVRSGHGALILVDQRLGGGPLIDFMGRPAETSVAAAQLARTLKAPLLTASARRLEDDSFIVRFDPPVPHGRPDEMMAEVNRRIEGWIDAAPEQWLWMHRRWRVRAAALRKFEDGGPASE